MVIDVLAAKLPSVVIFLAGPQPGDPDPTNGKGPEWGKAAPVALLIVVLLGLCVVFLVRSMNKHVKGLPASFEPAVQSGSTAQPDSSSDARLTETAEGTQVSTDRTDPPPVG